MKHPILLRLIAPLILLGSWWVVVSLRMVSPLILPSIPALSHAAQSLLLRSPGLWPDIGATIGRSLVSLAIAAAAGVPLGVLMGYVPLIYASLESGLEFARAIPPVTLFPLFILAFGFGELSLIATPLYGCIVIIILNSTYGVIGVPKVRRTVGRLSGLSRAAVFRKIIIPDALPQITVGLRTALSLSIVLTIVAEMLVGTDRGLGRKIYNYQLSFDSAEMYVAILIAGVIGYLTNRLFVVCQRRYVHWTDK